MTELRIARASLLIIAALAAGSALGAGPAGSSVSVEVATARTARVAPHAWIPGSIVSRDDARIAGIVAGRVVWIADNEPDPLVPQSGQLLRHAVLRLDRNLMRVFKDAE